MQQGRIIEARTVDGHVVGVSGGGTAISQVCRRWQIDGNGIGSEKAVHMALVLARVHNRVDVLAHKLVDVGVGKGQRCISRCY